MGLTREESYEILELPVGVDQDSIRTSYKRLALKWHPDKHSGSQDALTKFKLVSKSYKRLTTGESTDDMTLDQMLSLFKEVFFTRPINSYNGSGYDSSDDDDDDEDIEEEVKYSNLFPDKIKLKQDWKKAREEGDIMGKKLSAEEISRNAEELITEEEKEKRRAEKRRAKKKRRREKKKQEKTDTDSFEPQEEKKSSKQKVKEISENIPEKNKKTDMMGDASTSSDEAGFDPNSAFFTKVVNKKKKSPLSVETPPSRQRKEKGDKSDEESEELDPKTLRSRQLAIKGNEMAHLGHYNAAIELFSEAIKLDPKDFRFFGNRSYCYDRIQQYEKALKDAEKAISLAKDWPKGYFRQGRALAGLKMFPEAEQAFTQVLKLDKNCEDAVQELLRVRTHQIMEMGFTRHQAEAAIKKYGTVQAALDSLLAGVAENSLTSSQEVYVSDDEEFTAASQNSRTSGSDTKMDPKNPEGLTALWVGNVLPEVTDKKLHQMFARFGQVKSVRCLPEKYCAFVNFSTKEAAGKAMVGLQGVECGGQRLLIKFPDHPITNGNDHGTITLRKNQSNTTTTTKRHFDFGRKRKF
ncbi:uncharacterized protein LOC132722978 isoform X2 [Ruditapes philippinarum]|uniref:uncharacterized protein LOC132722978 isoform X2 n=1 Tax=Ruditapes philippinarum TaxID=129788 RepID=UPI00295BD272|nr:uncharacterized protein LOC132722978 isoform X2 [Ruditapes philippinarum]